LRFGRVRPGCEPGAGLAHGFGKPANESACRTGSGIGSAEGRKAVHLGLARQLGETVGNDRGVEEVHHVTWKHGITGWESVAAH
jgi:hypothetical protein